MLLGYEGEDEISCLRFLGLTTQLPSRCIPSWLSSVFTDELQKGILRVPRCWALRRGENIAIWTNANRAVL